MEEPSDNEPSDIFSVRDLQKRPSILPVEKVLTPPKELRRQRLRKVIIGAVLVLLLGISAYTAYHFVHRSRIQTAVLNAGNTGRSSAVQKALDTLGRNEDLGIQARLWSTLALSGEASLEDAQSVLARVPQASESDASERLKAETYLALARGDVQAATASASRLIPVGTYAAETAYTRASCRVFQRGYGESRF